MPEEKTQPNTKQEPIDVINQYTGEKWYYSPIVKDHFFHPRNLMLDDPDEARYDAKGMVGSPACILSSTLIQKNPAAQAIQEIERLLSQKQRIFFS